MQEKELDIDLSVHVCYSQKEKEVLQDYLSKRCSPDEAQRLWENAVFLPAFCNGDYPAMEAIGTVLIRKHTYANSYIYNESPAERV